MKYINIKRVLLLSVCNVVFAAHAQLKVNSNGKVYIQDSLQACNAMLNVGTLTNNFISYPTASDKVGITTFVESQQASTGCVGIHCTAIKPNHSGDATGIWSYAEGGFSIGVGGNIPPIGGGAGIFGSSEGGISPYIDLSAGYAGYFYGDTYVDGVLTADYPLYNPSDMRLKKNVVPLSQLTLEQGSVIDRLLQLEVLSYNLYAPSTLRKLEAGEELSDRIKEETKRISYGISAQELQKLFPDLVREGQDGYLTVNYTGMVPLLLHCIQELKQEIDELKSDRSSPTTVSVGLAPKVNVTTSIDNISAPTFALYQNAPNPFTERTTIRFTLPDDTQDAYIYVFDMQGKLQKQMPVDASMNSVTINGYELLPGMYIYSLVVGGKEIDMKRMIMSK